MGGGQGLKHSGIKWRAEIRLAAMRWMVKMGLCFLTWIGEVEGVWEIPFEATPLVTLFKGVGVGC